MTKAEEKEIEILNHANNFVQIEGGISPKVITASNTEGFENVVGVALGIYKELFNDDGKNPKGDYCG